MVAPSEILEGNRHLSRKVWLANTGCHSVLRVIAGISAHTTHHLTVDVIQHVALQIQSCPALDLQYACSLHREADNREQRREVLANLQQHGPEAKLRHGVGEFCEHWCSVGLKQNGW